ncbi:MAG: 50S ribosomal protein L4 [Chloroflexi bacterium]|nr:50S ribosomal protein L4 [Chloroflexota bacterium]
MQANVLNLSGEVVRTIDLDERVFGIRPNRSVVHQAVVTQQANARQGTHDTKTRAEVAGGGKKPYRQKGTGNARQGSIRAPHYRKGGIVFGPHPRSHALALPRKMRRLALRSVLSARVAEQNLIVVDSFGVDGGKTRGLIEVLARIGAADGALVVLGTRDNLVLRAARNLETVHAVTPNGMNLLDMLRLPRMILDTAAVEVLTKILTSDLAFHMPGEPATPARAAATATEPGAPRAQLASADTE